MRSQGVRVRRLCVRKIVRRFRWLAGRNVGACHPVRLGSPKLLRMKSEAGYQHSFLQPFLATWHYQGRDCRDLQNSCKRHGLPHCRMVSYPDDIRNFQPIRYPRTPTCGSCRSHLDAVWTAKPIAPKALWQAPQPSLERTPRRPSLNMKSGPPVSGQK